MRTGGDNLGGTSVGGCVQGATPGTQGATSPHPTGSTPDTRYPDVPHLLLGAH